MASAGFCRSAGRVLTGSACANFGWIDINREIIRQGHALACPFFDPRYLSDEDRSLVANQERASNCVSGARR
jgi:hypothetical protein